MTDNIKTIPMILRARDFRLYMKNGRRLVDLWLNGGAAILGHTPPKMLRELKNTASRGLYAPFPHFSEGRFIKALSLLFPGYSFRLYAAPPPELSALFSSGDAKLWRPFTESDNASLLFGQGILMPGILIPGILIPILPGIQSWRNELPLGLCVAAAKSENELAKLPPSDILPPILLATAARGLHDIIAASERAKPAFPRVFKVLQKSGIIWQRQGIYLTVKDQLMQGSSLQNMQETWEALFHKFLDAGFLLPPVPYHPLILPGELSAGEEAKLAKVLC